MDDQIIPALLGLLLGTILSLGLLFIFPGDLWSWSEPIILFGEHLVEQVT